MCGCVSVMKPEKTEGGRWERKRKALARGDGECGKE